MEIMDEKLAESGTENTAFESEDTGAETTAEMNGGWRDNRGVGVVEIILILVILIALVLIFKTQMTALVNTIFSTITTNANAVIK